MPRNGKLWTEDEVIFALFLRFMGLTDADIARELGRTVASVRGHPDIGCNSSQTVYVKWRPEPKVFEAARAFHAKFVGQRADDMLALLPAMGSA
jgi:hypothetical protein